MTSQAKIDDELGSLRTIKCTSLINFLSVLFLFRSRLDKLFLYAPTMKSDRECKKKYQDEVQEDQVAAEEVHEKVLYSIV